MPQAARVSIKTSREKLNHNNYTPDSEEVLEYFDITNQEYQSRLDAAANFLFIIKLL